MKASSTASVSDPIGRIPVLFQYLRDELSHGPYMLCPLPPSINTLLLNHDSGRSAAARRAQDTSPGPAIGGPMVPGLGLGRGGSSGRSPPGQRRVPVDGNPFPNPRPTQRLCLLPGKNTCSIFWNVALPILGGTGFCKHWNMGFFCFDECPQKGSHTHSLAAVVEKILVEMAMATAWAPTVGAYGST